VTTARRAGSSSGKEQDLSAFGGLAPDCIGVEADSRLTHVPERLARHRAVVERRRDSPLVPISRRRIS
jgi:hypothetical protein